MKKFKLIYALLAVALFVTACRDEELINEGRVPAADGSEIIFGGRAGFESSDPEGRTVYTGEYYKVGDKNFERIDWIDGDKIEIYSAEASNGSSAHYNITSFKTGDETAGDTGKGSDYAYLERQGESSLQWNGDVDHTFYAMYPSTSMFVREDVAIPTVEQGIKLDKSGDNIVVKGTVPTSQSGTITESNGNYTIAPNMKYAYMVARTTANRNDNPNVGLSFVPIVTAVEIEMIVPENPGKDVHDVLIAEIQVTGKGIAGDFTADLTSWEEGKYPVCTNVDDGQGTIQISTWKDNKPLTLTDGKSVKFTVFMRPGADYNNLTVSYSPTGSGYIRKNLFGTDSNNNAYNVNIPRNLKTRIKNLHLPATYDEKTQIVVDASRWMDQLADTVKFKALSIPGTGGTFSYNYSSSNPGWYKQQTVDFETQWKLGIRAFEIVSDRPSSSSTSLGDQYVKCNKVSMGVTVSKVLTDLLAKVKGTVTDPVTNEVIYNPTETAVLILTYQPEGNSPNRNGATYASSLKELYNDLSKDQQEQIIQYTPALTLAEARGKVMIFCRINQRDEKDNGDTSDKTAFQLATETLNGTNITLINGCGTGKDRWGARGYKVGSNVAYDAANTGDENKSVDYYLTQNWVGSSLQWPDWTKVSKPKADEGDLNFAFDTNFKGISCWYQEWARVVPSSIIDKTLGFYQVKNTGLGILDVYADYRWYESYTEKVAAANKTFDMAISGLYPNYIFINSLCGYFVDKNIESSYTPFTGSNTGGIAGNIKGLADEINVDFYQHVLTSGFEQATGPTGIVMMDYAKNAPESEIDGGYYLPGVIISNNFKGNLATKPDGGTGGGNTGGNTGGGSGSGEDVGGEEKP